jgi:hypothetical protein
VDTVTGLEVIKLLLQVVWADDVVTSVERDALFAAADRLAGDGGRALLTATLDERQPLPAPNMGLLVRHRAEVLKEVARLSAVDGIHADELDLVATIGGMLR